MLKLFRLNTASIPPSAFISCGANAGAVKNFVPPTPSTLMTGKKRSP
jgi:hypothetical protein